MNQIIFKGMPSDQAGHLRDGGNDAHGQTPQIAVSDGDGLPCRHCMQMIEKGAAYLIVSHKPFSTTQPYAEQGPIFLHAEFCAAYKDDGNLPSVFDSPTFIIRGYDASERIISGTGSVVERRSVVSKSQQLLDNPQARFVHIRSASNNCWLGLIERAPD